MNEDTKRFIDIIERSYQSTKTGYYNAHNITNEARLAGFMFDMLRYMNLFDVSIEWRVDKVDGIRPLLYEKPYRDIKYVRGTYVDVNVIRVQYISAVAADMRTRFEFIQNSYQTKLHLRDNRKDKKLVEYMLSVRDINPNNVMWYNVADKYYGGELFNTKYVFVLDDNTKQEAVTELESWGYHPIIIKDVDDIVISGKELFDLVSSYVGRILLPHDIIIIKPSEYICMTYLLLKEITPRLLTQYEKTVVYHEWYGVKFDKDIFTG